jgi:hypothetical protein
MHCPACWRAGKDNAAARAWVLGQSLAAPEQQALLQVLDRAGK